MLDTQLRLGYTAAHDREVPPDGVEPENFEDDREEYGQRITRR